MGKTEDGNKEEVNKEEESKEEKTEENKEEPKEGEKEEKKEGSEEEKKDGEKAEEKKTSIILRIKSQVFPSKSKKEDTAESGEKPEEAEKLLEEKADDEKTEGKEKEKDEGSSLLQRIRNVASGVPALFKKDTAKEVDVEAGEKDELLDNKEEKQKAEAIVGEMFSEKDSKEGES